MKHYKAIFIDRETKEEMYEKYLGTVPEIAHAFVDGFNDESEKHEMTCEALIEES